MRVTVRLFARLREIAGAGELVLDLETPATIRAVWAELASRHSELAATVTSTHPSRTELGGDDGE